MGNVIEFPGVNKRIIEPETVLEQAENVKYYHVQETVQNIMPIIINALSAAGFDFTLDENDQVENIKDGALLVECLRSMLLRHYDIDHPFQALSEVAFKEKEGLLYLDNDLVFTSEDQINGAS